VYRRKGGVLERGGGGGVYTVAIGRATQQENARNHFFQSVPREKKDGGERIGGISAERKTFPSSAAARITSHPFSRDPQGAPLNLSGDSPDLAQGRKGGKKRENDQRKKGGAHASERPKILPPKIQTEESWAGTTIARWWLENSLRVLPSSGVKGGGRPRQKTTLTKEKQGVKVKVMSGRHPRRWPETRSVEGATVAIKTYNCVKLPLSKSRKFQREKGTPCRLVYNRRNGLSHGRPARSPTQRWGNFFSYQTPDCRR